MDAALFERLLNEEEGATLDFKKEQYPFSKATDEEKSELLKDILAFANAWRRADAYILRGVEEVRGGRSNVVGVSEHLDDHSLQQFVSHLTNRPPHFSYEAFTFEGKQVGIIKIDDRQARPFYLKADYGKLKKKVVYVRRGSSTCEADIDEIARMGTPVVQEQADLRLEFAELDREASLGDSIQLQSTYCEMPPMESIPEYGVVRGGGRYDYALPVSVMERLNAAYYREKAIYDFTTQCYRPVRLLVTNAGDATAQNVRVEIAVVRENGGVLEKSKMPEKPEKREHLAMANELWQQMRPRHDGQRHVETHADKFKIIIECGTLQPKRSIASDTFFVAKAESGQLKLAGLIYAENLSTPKAVELHADFTITRKQVSIRELVAEDIGPHPWIQQLRRPLPHQCPEPPFAGRIRPRRDTVFCAAPRQHSPQREPG